jgi:hypothetical protein
MGDDRGYHCEARYLLDAQQGPWARHSRRERRVFGIGDRVAGRLFPAICPASGLGKASAKCRQPKRGPILGTWANPNS